MRMMSSPLGMSQSYSTNNPIHVQNGAVSNSGPASAGENMSRTYSPSPRPIVSPSFHDGQKRSMDAAKNSAPQNIVSRDLSEEAYRATVNNRHLARIIIAERELKLKMEYEANNYGKGKNQPR